jgi:hypothetical protein
VSGQRRAVDPRTGRLYRVVGPPRRFDAPPEQLRHATLDNLALVPASMLPYRKEYQAIANHQPPGTTLIVLPSSGGRQRAALEGVASGLRAKGRRVATVSVRQFNHPHP